MSGERAPLVLFLVLSVATVLCYWLWFLYLEHLRLDDGEQEAGLAPLYLLLILPVLLLYRSLQEMPAYQREVDVVVVHVKNIEPVKVKEKKVLKMIAPRPRVEEKDPSKIVSLPPNQDPVTKPSSWIWPRVAKRPQTVPTSHQVTPTNPPVLTNSAGFAGKLARLSRKLTKVSGKLTPKHKLVKVGTKKPAKLLWLRAKLAKLGKRNDKRISFEVSGEPSVEDMRESPTRRKSGKMKKKFSGVFKKLPAMINKLSRNSKE